MKIIFFILIISIFMETNLIGGETIFHRVFENLHYEPSTPVEKSRVEIQTKWITQKVDNFNETDTRKWQMRYMENGVYFKEGGDIFIHVGGEWAITPGSLQGGLLHDIAKEHNGYLFYTEHRYYGKSYPLDDLSTKNLQYLSVGQSLADLAHFIKTVKSTIPGLRNSKVILSGGSYSATMVTWFKRIYPELATGSWGSSAPLLAKVDFIEYKEIAGKSIKLVGGEKCFNHVKEGFSDLENMITSNKAKFKEIFNLCDDFNPDNELDVWTLFSELSDIFAGYVQTHSNGTIERACERILEKESPAEGIASLIKSSDECTQITYKHYVKSLSDLSIHKNQIMRQWFYQTCSEFGWYQTSGSQNQPFGSKFPVELYIHLCRDAYGEKFSNATIHGNAIQTNFIYGGMNPEVKNVVLTHGQLDPWRAMGIQEQDKESNVIPLYAHCKDLGSITDKDTPEMKASKLRVKSLIEKWLKE